MPTNANTFNSRVTSEALERKFRDVFPAQGGAELVQDLYASGVVQPVIDFSSVAEGSVLPQYLQTAWDLSTGHASVVNTTSTLITNTGFWKLDLTWAINQGRQAKVFIDAGVTTKTIWQVDTPATDPSWGSSDESFIVFLKTGESLKCTSNNVNNYVNVWWRQVADVNGTLVNPLGFTFS